MPRDVGTGIYTYPSGTPGIPGQTVFSARYNTFLNDLSNTLNQPLPINMGGTGADDAAEARAKLKVEVGGAQVTNYDSHIFENGSFWSAPGATSAPSSEWHVGICVLNNNDPNSIILSARNNVTGLLYYRVKSEGVWGVWKTEGDNKVDVAGDTMTGPLFVTPKGSVLGSAGGTVATGSVTQADANVMLYNFTADNWAGMGADVSGNMWFRTGLSGAPLPAMWIGADGFVSISQGPTSTNHVASKYYADTTLANGLATKVQKTGDVMTGPMGIQPAGSNLPAFPGALRIGYVTSATDAITIRPTGGEGSSAVVFENTVATTIGSIFINASATAYNTSSDERLKEDLKSFDAGNIIDETNVYDFAWKSTGERSYGIIAQQAIDVYPTAVTRTPTADKDDEWWGIDYSKYVPVILQELKALRVRVAEMEARLEGKPA